MKKNALLIFVLLPLICSVAHAKIILPAILSDHMVLQQKDSVKIWGWTTSTRETLRIWGSWGGDTVQAKAALGRWEALILTPPAGGPYTLTISGHQQKVIQDILIGEVWLASGQSNMEMKLDSSSKGMPGVTNFRREIQEADYPEIRLFKAHRRYAQSPQIDLEGEWVTCKSKDVVQHSAVAYYFSRMLYDSLKVPIGSVLSSWGGTPAEVWTRKEAVMADSVLAQTAPKTMGKGSPQGPGILFNAMIHPLIDFTFKGIIWYQGESNRSRYQTYRRNMEVLIQNWRREWGYALPFYFVQIAPYDYSTRKSPCGCFIREAQLQNMDIPHTGMVVTADVGDMLNIHPRRKRQVGERLAFWALAKDYGYEELAYSGPIYRGYEIKANEIHISFDHVGKGLEIKGDQLLEVEIAGEDQQFYPAKARIKAENLIISHPQVARPVAVRYGFKDTDQMNLFNVDGLPASPFRTDTWKK
ncbi:MAG: sialate O-acetylesterase [Bacteroidota bacterium]